MAKALDPMEQIAVTKRDRMAAIETAYLRAKEYEKTEQFFTDQLVALAKIRVIVRQGILEHGESLMILGRVQQILLDAYHHESVILEYEQLKKSLAERYPQ